MDFLVGVWINLLSSFEKYQASSKVFTTPSTLIKVKINIIEYKYIILIIK